MAPETDTGRAPTTDDPAPPPEYTVPDGAGAVSCSHCGAPFADEELLALHRGLEHPEALDAAERAAFEDAYDEESDDIRRFRIVALGLLVLLYFGLLLTYAVVT